MKKTHIAILSIAAFSSFPTVKAASILLTAENFAILGGTAITSTGTVGTVIRNGDIGLFPTATTGITGFPPAVIVNGSMIATGPVTDQARLDLITLQTELALMPSDTNLSGIDLGGMILSSGVYTFDVAAALTGNLILDGQGMDDAFWVFQIGTSMTTSADSTITVINSGPSGGSDYGVFWNAGSEIIIGATNDILGNYLSGTSITMGAQSGGSGRALALAAVTLDQNDINAFGGSQSSDWTGGLAYDISGSIVQIPEPSAALLSALTFLGFLFIQRRRVTQVKQS